MDEVISVRRSHGAVTVEFASGARGMLPAAMLEQFPIRRGQALSPDDVERFVEEHGPGYAAASLMALQAAREHSRRELREALIRKAYPEAVADEAVDRFCRSGLAEDLRCGEAIVHRRQRSRGRAAILREMRSRGLEEDTALQALETLDPETERAGALRYALKMQERGAGRDRIFRSLLYRGYGKSLILSVLDTLDEEGNE